MKVVISARNFDLSDRLKTHIEKRAQKLARFYDDILDCQVKIVEEKLKKVDVVVNIDRQVLKSSDETESVYVSVDRSMDKMQRQLKKIHDKRRLRRAPGVEPVEVESDDSVPV